MKKKILFTLFAVTLFGNLHLLAQWVTNGSTIVWTSDNVGVNTSSPNSRLHVNSSSGQNGLRVQINGTTRLLVSSNGGVAVGSNTTPPTNGLFVSGNAGIGTSSPAVKLHVFGGTDASPSGGGYIVAGSTTGANVVIDENEIMARSNGATSALFLNHNGGNLIINGTNATGNVGIGTTSPTSKLQVVGNFDFDGEGTGITFDDGQFIRDGAASLDIACHGNLVPDNNANHTLGTSANQWSAVWAIDGSINLVSSNTTTNVKDLTYGIKEIMQLRPVSYNMLNNPEGGEGVKRLGLLANEMKPVLPEAVRDWDYSEDKMTGKVSKIAIDKLGVSIDNVVPVLIKAMQEQQQIIQKQQQEIKAFEDRLTKLEASLSSVKSNGTNNSSDLVNKKIIGASLEQNQPNPFRQNTIIRYSIPSGVNAQIMIYDASGRLVKTLQATQSGQAQINGGDLKAGTYRYTLVANGNLIASKTMVLLK